jgi:hypothetical protein
MKILIFFLYLVVFVLFLVENITFSSFLYKISVESNHHNEFAIKVCIHSRAALSGNSFY